MCITNWTQITDHPSRFSNSVLILYFDFVQSVSFLLTHQSAKLFCFFFYLFVERSPLQAHTYCLEMRGLPRIYAKVGLRVPGVETQKFKPDMKVNILHFFLYFILCQKWGRKSYVPWGAKHLLISPMGVRHTSDRKNEIHPTEYAH